MIASSDSAKAAPPDRDPKRPVAWAAAAAPWILLVAALTTLALLRQVESHAEIDRYTELAERTLVEGLVVDRYHAFGYPLLLAALVSVTGASSFAAGLLVNTIAAVAAVWAGARIAELVLPGSGRIAAWLLAANAVLWTAGSTVEAAMPAAAALLLALAVGAGTGASWSAARAAVVGALLGAAPALHTSTLILAAGLGVFLVCRCRPHTSRLTLAAGVVAGYLPQLIPSLLTSTPLTGDTWHNVYLKVRCGFDGECLQQAVDSGSMPSMTGYLLGDLGSIVDQGLDDLLLAVDQVLPAAAIGSQAGIPGIAWWLPLLALAALLLPARDRGLGVAVLGLALLQTVFTSFTFHPMARLLLPSIVATGVGIAVLVARLRLPAPGRAALVAVVVAGMLAAGSRTVQLQREREPVHEVLVARSLPAAFDGPIAVLSTYRLLDRYVDYPCWSLMRSRANDFTSHAAAWGSLRRRLEACGANVLMVGRVSDPDAFAAVTAGPLPPDFEVVYQDDLVLAAAHREPTTDWIEAVTSTPSPARRDEVCELVLRLSATADEAEIASVGASVRGPDGAQRLLTLHRQPDGGYRGAMLPTAAGSWIVVPVLVHRNGTVLRGPVHRIPVVE